MERLDSHSWSSLHSPLRGHDFETSLWFQLCFLGHPHLMQMLSTAIYAFSPPLPPPPPAAPACPSPCPLHDMNSLAFSEPLLTTWVLLSFHISFLFIYFYPQAYSVCTIVWIIMNFGFSSKMSKACFQLNKPNEVKSFILSPPPLFTLFSLLIPVGRMSKKCIL